jgi:hypothetical protein
MDKFLIGVVNSLTAIVVRERQLFYLFLGLGKCVITPQIFVLKAS